MKTLTKKRLKAYLIDSAVSTALSFAVESLLRKKVKNEAVHSIVTPTVVMWALEYIQLRNNGQTIGYKTMGLAIENKDGSKLTNNQIAKRILYRDTVSTFVYLKDRERFEGEDGSIFPHDHFAGTIVIESRQD
nr:RDD family protein [Lysinibacillus timonensis]